MPLSATLAASGMRPASFLPTITCSSCGDEIEISAMGDHTCSKAPPSPRSQPASLSNPFTLRQMNANNSKPAQPSPLQFDNPPRQTRSRAPTLGSSVPPSSRIPRAPLPQINPDAANKPFLAPLPRPASPISPVPSSRSGSSISGRPSAPQRSMTTPMPRLWDPRPPSPELSANLDCAFPPFPFGDNAPGSRPGSSNGRNTPGSERGSSRADSRSDGRFADTSMSEPRSPVGSKGSENVLNRMNTMKSGPFDPAQSNTGPLDRRRPSIARPGNVEMPAMPPVPVPNSSRPMDAASNAPAQQETSNTDDYSVEKKLPPQRPTRPETLPQGLLDNIAPALPAADFPLPPAALRPAQPSAAASLARDASDDADSMAPLTKVPSEPSPRGRSTRPAMPESSRTEPAPAFPTRSTSRVGTSRIDYRMQDAPPVPKPVQQLHRSNSHHRPSGSDSSTASSTRSVENSNTSSLGASPVTSAASSVDAFSPLSTEVNNLNRQKSLRPAGKGEDNPGMRAEMPKQRKSPPRNFARPVAPKAVEPPLESPVLPTSNWPLESPMDPALRDGILGDAQQTGSSAAVSPMETPKANATPGYGLSPADFLSDEYDPYKPISPRVEKAPSGFPPARPRSKTNSEAPMLPLFPPTAPPPLRSGTPTLLRSKTFDVESSKPSSPPSFPSRSQSIPQDVPRPPPIPHAVPQPPPIPEDLTPAPLSRSVTSGKKPICRACSLPITSRAVKAADGRLTGRWHKHCFVCRSCSAPFPNADFYVLHNHPYCEQHYHEENGSLCAGCYRGIEGEYLETSSSSSGKGGAPGQRKFHPRCFTCATCRLVLAEDYFEIGGRVFCERHAVAAMRPPPRAGPAVGGGRGGMPRAGGLAPPRGGPPFGPPGGLRAERRTTKLMMMS